MYQGNVSVKKPNICNICTEKGEMLFHSEQHYCGCTSSRFRAENRLNNNCFRQKFSKGGKKHVLSERMEATCRLNKYSNLSKIRPQ